MCQSKTRKIGKRTAGKAKIQELRIFFFFLLNFEKPAS
jgi:hypothetical protein